MPVDLKKIYILNLKLNITYIFNIQEVLQFRQILVNLFHQFENLLT